MDSVATLAGVPLDVDRERIDICFSGTQKAMSAPPGMSPITVNARAEEMLRNRKTKVQSWYFDLTTVMNYWGKESTYHHTPPIPLIYALHEALRMVLEEGLEGSWERHRQNQTALIAGLEAMGIACSSRIRRIAWQPSLPSEFPKASTVRKCAAACSMNLISKSPAD